MIPFLIPPAVERAPAPPPLENAALDFCREVAPQMGWEAPTKPSSLKALRSQATTMLSVCTKSLPSESRSLPLLEAALGALEVATGEEAKGEKRYGRAAKNLALRWRNGQKEWGRGNLRLLPELENLTLLYELGGLRASNWRDEALRIRAGIARTPDPLLEKDLAAAVEDHYGPWLTVVELEPMLEFSHHLARVWENYSDDRQLTRQVMRLGLKPDAHRVWGLAAKEASESQRLELAALVDRLDPETVMRECAQEAGVDTLLELGKALMGTPLEGAARSLLKRLDMRLREGNKAQDPLRRRIAKTLEDWGGWAGLLRGALAEATSRDAIFALLGEAESFLGEHRDGGLLETGTWRLEALAHSGSVDGLAQHLEAWAAFQTNAGHALEAEELLGICLDLADPKGQDLPARCELLANLGRWKELQELLGAPREQESERVLGWRFRAALGLGEVSEAKRWIEAWLVAAPEIPEEPSGPLGFHAPEVFPRLPGLSAAIPWFQARPEALAPLVARYGARLLSGQGALLAREPWRILVALDPEAPQDLQPTKAEEALRWRWSRLPSGAMGMDGLEQLIQDAEKQLSASHVLVAELLADLGERQGDKGLPSLERAQCILEASPGHEQLLIEVDVSMAAICSQLDGKGLERNLLKAMELLERMPRLEGEIQERAEFLPLLLIHFWRQQRLDELMALGTRIQALGRRMAKGSLLDEADQELALRALGRTERLQRQLRAAGLP